MARGEFRIFIDFGAEGSLILAGLSSVEMEMVRDWTEGRITNRAAWAAAIANDDVAAIKAAKLIMLKRAGDKTSRFDAVEFNFDDIDAYYIDDDGREVEPDLEFDADGDPVVTEKLGLGVRQKVHKNADGSDRWLYTDTREPVPPTQSGSRRRTRAATPSPSGSSTASAPGTPTTGEPAPATTSSE